MEISLKRLYIGGIGPSVTGAELTERFGKFGKVSDVDIISRKDEHGNPVKTFAYLNISISDVELKKCMSVLNKTKWKGGVLQIERAKESFLHRLSQEREEAKEKKKPQLASKPDLVQSLKEAGVNDFQMKAAVPGTEVPNHKNWVVSKYGRVLPVLHLKGDKQMNVMKYDPSKYCHNIKKLEEISTEMTPVSQLTWHVEGGDDEMSRKRRGEFPVFKSPTGKKVKLQKCLGADKIAEGQTCNRTLQICDRVIGQSSSASHKSGFSRIKKEVNGREVIGSRNSISDGENDSEDELRTVLENKKKSEKGGIVVEDSNIEVVDDSFKMRFNSHWDHRNEKAVKDHGKNAKDDEDYDSADTDEIIAVAKTVQKVKEVDKEMKDTVTEKLPLQDGKEKSKLGSSDTPLAEKQKPKFATNDEPDLDSENSDSGSERSDSDSDEEYNSMMQTCQTLCFSLDGLEKIVNAAKESTDDDDDDSMSEETESDRSEKDPGSDSSDSYSDEEYDSMMQNCYRLTLSMGDLEKLASTTKDSSEEDTTNEKTENDQTGKEQPNKSPVIIKKMKKGIAPEDIVASILEDSDDSADEKQKRKSKKEPSIRLPAFKGLGSLLKGSSERPDVSIDSSPAPSSVKSCTKVKTATNKSNKVTPEVGAAVSRKESETQSGSRGLCESGADHGLQASSQPKVQRKLDGEVHQDSSSSDESSSDEESSADTSPTALHTKSANTSNAMEKDTSRKRGLLKQLQDNQTRLAAMEERRKERELQKQTIQGALLKTDSQASSKGQHIKFESDSETQSEEEVKESDVSTIPTEKVQNVTAKLFDSSEEESDEDCNKEDEERFQIKSQYEGRSGAKLLNLQTRFGTDKRFRMDSRFLDTSSEDEGTKVSTQTAPTVEGEDDLSAEKKKNLGILSSLLNINTEPQPPSKQAAKAKKFKDLNALQYDPTREDHATFETQAEEEKKESKSERKKKRQEAEKLPEVSQETYHEVTVDLKEVFGTLKPTSETEAPSTTWDQEEEKEVEDEYLSLQNKEEPEGFTFSFFGASTEDSVTREEPYATENIKRAKVAWQEDPRFQDSSSDGEEEEEEEEILTKEPTLSTQTGPAKNMRFFFFVRDDERLKAGPKMFFSSSNLEEEREVWEQRRESLLEECRKRHKDARRKIKSKH
ncbi:nucleolar protein 8 [Pelodytes ibericus]